MIRIFKTRFTILPILDTLGYQDWELTWFGICLKRQP